MMQVLGTGKEEYTRFFLYFKGIERGGEKRKRLRKAARGGMMGIYS